MRKQLILTLFLLLLLLGCGGKAQESQQDEKIQNLIKKLEGEYKPESPVVGQLAEIGAPAVKFLIAALESTDEGSRAHAAEALGRISHRDAVEPLILALSDDSTTVRRGVVSALGNIGDKRSFQPLINLLKKPEGDRGTRSSAVWALGQTGGRKAVPLMIRFITDDDPLVRMYAAIALDEMPDTRAFGVLVQALHDTYEPVQCNAASALGKIGDRKAVEHLTWLLAERDWEVRCITAWALGRLGGDSALENLKKRWKRDPDQSVRTCAAFGLAKAGNEEASRYLIEALESDNSDVVSRAAEALGELEDRRALRPLVNLTKRKNEMVLFFATEALKRITKQDFGENHDKWKTWYEDNRDK